MSMQPIRVNYDSIEASALRSFSGALGDSNLLLQNGDVHMDYSELCKKYSGYA